MSSLRANGRLPTRLRFAALAVILLATLLFPLGPDAAAADDLELPDLVSVPPTRVQPPEEVTWRGATSLVVRFDGHVTNVGEGPLDLFGNPSAGTVKQRARTASGSWVDVASPQVIYETADGHNHWHLMKVSRYSLWNESKTAEVAPGQKVGFCLYDVRTVPDAPVVDPSFYEGSVVRWCEVGNPGATQLRMGISAGHQDVYDKSLTYQWVDVSDVQPGTYWVAAQIDPENVVVEASEANNTLSFSSSPVVVPGHVAQPVGPVPVAEASVVIDLEAVQVGSPPQRVFRIVDPPEHGTLNVAQGADIWGSSVTYTPDPGYTGADGFTYVAADPVSSYPRNPVAAAVVIDVGAQLPPSVAISGAPASLIGGTSAQLYANAVNADPVDWYVDGVPGGSAAVGTITPAGLYRAPGTPPPAGRVTIRAQSRNLPDVFDEVTITIEPPLLPPVIDPRPGPRTDLVGDAVSMTVTATDENGDVVRYWARHLPPGVSIDEATGVISGTLTSYGTYEVIVYATDGVLSDSAQFVWTVNAQPPVIDAIGDLSVAEGSSATVEPQITDPQGLPYICTLLGPSFVSKGADDRLVIAPGYDDAGEYEVTLVVTNEGGGSASTVFSVLVENVNRPPVVGYIEDQNVTEGAEARVAVAVSDPDGDSVSVAVTGEPFITYDDAGGEIVLAPGYGDAGTSTVVVTATDDQGLSASREFTVTVADANRAPIIAPIAPVAADEGTTVRIPIEVHDPDGDAVTVEIVGPAFAEFDAASGEVVVSPGFLDAGTHSVTVIATDTWAAAAQAVIAVEVTDVNRDPSISGLGDVSVQAGAVATIAADISDPDGDPVTVLIEAPPFITLDGSSIEIAPGLSDVGQHLVTVEASDGRGGIVTASFGVNVYGTNEAPEIQAQADLTTPTAAVVDLTFLAHDADGDELRFTATGLPPGLELDHATGAVAGTVPFEAAGIHEVVVSVSDGVVASTIAFTWTIVDEAPDAVVDVRIVGRGERAVLELSGRASTDPEGGPLRFFWDFDGDGRYDDARRWWTRLEVTGGTYEIGLRVVDPAGNDDEHRLIIEVP